MGGQREKQETPGGNLFPREGLALSMASWRVRLEPEGKVIEADEAEDVWTAAARQGVPLPSSCLEGSCTTCTGRLLEGQVEQDRALALRAEEKARSFVLLCVARPRSDCVVRTHCADELG